MNFIMLASLNADHFLRNSELGVLNAQCRNLKSSTWRDVSNWKIATSTYNELSGPWIDCAEFRVPDVEISKK